MQPENGQAGDAAHWLLHAESDLALAKTRDNPDILPETLCFHAQQTAEKALKAVFVYKKIDFPRTHNIKTLVDLLALTISIPENIHEAGSLTEYAVETRYPGDYETITHEEYLEAIQLAEEVLSWAKTIVGDD